MMSAGLLSDRQKMILDDWILWRIFNLLNLLLENFNLLDAGSFLLLALNIVVSVIVCLVGVWLGYRMAA